MAVKNLAGELKTPIVFKKNTFTSSGSGALDSYVTFCTTRCKLTSKSANKINDKNQVVISTFYEIIVRYQTTLFSNLTGTVIAIIGNETYTIHGFDLVGNTKQFYMITASKFKI